MPAAERSVDGQRAGQFSAEELVAFSLCFGGPVGLFAFPPLNGAADRMICVEAPDSPRRGVSLSELTDIMTGALTGGGT